ncbi:hypothetical protein K461DRAFT_266766 [Myriangium duriaei CBS 260.36]|uniref:Uncharacterized protein n=1 Tax=Myriangium duriaei CBS 260.36 TaxID=1168546 RepID=A0A9P4MKY2_9PEZI|nr:hypothetical protein K461DRAFT_266766 [Myriangium duriaei CBS 260.36]
MSPITGASRSPTVNEARFLSEFEAHARSCVSCVSCYNGYRRDRSLCAQGRILAANLSHHVYRQDHRYYSRTDGSDYTTRVEVAKSYHQVRQLLKLIEKYGLLAIERAPVPHNPTQPTYRDSLRQRHNGQALGRRSSETNSATNPTIYTGVYTTLPTCTGHNPMASLGVAIHSTASISPIFPDLTSALASWDQFGQPSTVITMFPSSPSTTSSRGRSRFHRRR